jgi:membrane fusion protein (multidrug efflux system)
MHTRSRHPLRFLALAAVVSTTFLTACGDKQAAPGGGAPPAPRLAAIVLQPAAASEGLTATGTVLAEQEVNVQAEISGKVVALGFREGEAVKAGQILIELDGAELKAQADRAEANLMLAKTRADRIKQDFKAQAVSQSEYDQVMAGFKTAQAEAALTRAQFEKTRIRAPFAGKTGLREVELGSVVQPGARVTSLQNLASLRVEFAVPERQASYVRGGMDVTFTVAGTVDTLSATVFAVESRIDPDTRLVRVRARTPGAAATKVLPGAFARVVLPLRGDSALWVPAEAVVQSARGSMVWVARGGVARPQVFTPGLRTPDAVEAAAGLNAGDTIFVSGLMQLRPDAPAVAVVAAASSDTSAKGR